MNLPNKQRGMTGIGWLMVIGLIILVLLVVIKLLPVYIDHFNVTSVLSTLKDEPGVADMSPGEVTATLVKRLDINMVKDVDRDNIYITQEGNNRVIEVEYQVQRNIVGNVDVLIHFNDRVEVPAR